MTRSFKAVRLNAESFPVAPEEIPLLEEAGADWMAIEGKAPEEILAAAADCDALLVISSKVPPAVVEGLRRCRVIARLGSGTDRIAVDVATRRGIVVSNVPDFCVAEMAEHTLALLLAWGRRLFYMAEQMRRGDWDARRHPGVHRIAGQTLGLIGFGAGAEAVAVRARAFDMGVQAWVRDPEKATARAACRGVDLVDFDTLLATSDYVSLHVPLTPETRGMIGAGQLRLMKPAAVLINTARGALVDEEALATVLRENRIGGAALDTFEAIDVFGTHGPPAHPLLELDNVILTPHCSGCSVEATRDMQLRGARNAALVLRGEWPPYVVNPGVHPVHPLNRPADMPHRESAEGGAHP